MNRIVILSQYFPPETGAPQSRLYETVKGLKERGWKVKVVTAMPNYPTGKIEKSYRGKFRVDETIEEIDVSRYALYASNSKKTLPRIWSMLSFSMTSFFSLLAIRKFQPRYIFTESPPLTLALTGLWLSKLSGAKHVMNVSDIWPLSAKELGAIGDGKTYHQLERLENFLYRKSFACTGQSQEIVTHLKNNGATRTHLYRNGVNTARFEARRKYTRTSEKLQIVYAGLLGIAQGILNLCRNIDFAGLNAELHIYGDGNENNRLKTYLSQSGRQDVILHEAVGREEIPEILTQYNATLIPLVKPIYGAVPSKVYEAMAAGLPVIFAGGGEGAKIIEQYQAGVQATPGDYADIAQCIKQFGAMTKEELCRMGENGINAAREVFDRSIQIEALHTFLLNAE